MSTLRTYNLQNPDSSNVNIELTQGSGAVVAGVATFSSNVRVSGNLNVDGVLSYEDVTNIDSVGLITARSGINVTGGKVSVGSDNPSGNLNISYLQVGKGQVSSDHSLYNYNTSFTNNAYQNGNGTFAHITSRPVGVINLQDNVLTFSNGPGGTVGQSATLTERLRITSDGDVGIGYNTPTVKLHIREAASGVSSYDNRYHCIIEDDAEAYYGVYVPNNGYGGLRVIDGSGNVGSRLDYYVNENQMHYQCVGDHIFSTSNNAERLRITDAGDLFVAGTGGMNTTQLPNGSTINVNGTSSNDGLSVIRYSTGYGAYGLNIGRSKSNTLGTNAAVTNGNDLGHITFYGADGTDFNQAAMITAQVDGTPSDGTDMPGRLVFKTSSDGSATPTERLRIQSNGRVGINRATSSFMLDIVGNSSTGANCIRIVDGAETGHGSHPAKIVAGGTYYQEMQMHSRRFAVHTWNGSNIAERFRVHQDGTVTTGGLSSIPGTVAAGSIISAAANAGVFVHGYDGKFGTSSNHPLYLQVNGVTKATVTAGGAFSVGTTSPQQPNVPSMHLHSTANDDARIAITTPSKPNSRIGYFGLSNKFGMDVHNGFEVRDASASYATRLAVDSLGRVTTPSQPSFGCIKSGHQYPTNGQRVTIAPWTEHFDQGSNFNATTGAFTAPVAGKYFFYISVMMDRNDNGDYQISIYRNGSLYYNSNDMVSNTNVTFLQTTVSGIVEMSANDTVDFRMYNGSGTSSYIYQNHYTHCGGYLIG